MAQVRVIGGPIGGRIATMGDFEATLAQTMHGVMISLFGAIAGAAVEGHLDPSLAVSDPMAYASKLESLVGTSPADVILRRMEYAISVRFGLAKRKWQSFSECVEAARRETHNI